MNNFIYCKDCDYLRKRVDNTFQCEQFYKEKYNMGGSYFIPLFCSIEDGCTFGIKRTFLKRKTTKDYIKEYFGVLFDDN